MDQFLRDDAGLAVAKNHVFPGCRSTQNGDPHIDTHVITSDCVGDMSGDSTVDFGDVNPFVLAISPPVGWQAQYPDCRWTNGDRNSDSAVDFGDINPLVALLVAWLFQRARRGPWDSFLRAAPRCPTR